MNHFQRQFRRIWIQVILLSSIVALAITVLVLGLIGPWRACALGLAIGWNTLDLINRIIDYCLEQGRYAAEKHRLA